MRMSPADFDELLGHLKPALAVDDAMALLATPNGALIPEQRLALTLQFLGGAKVISLVDIFKVGVSTAYRVIWQTLNAIISCDALCTELDTSASVCPHSSCPMLEFQMLAYFCMKHNTCFHIFLDVCFCLFFCFFPCFCFCFFLCFCPLSLSPSLSLPLSLPLSLSLSPSLSTSLYLSLSPQACRTRAMEFAARSSSQGVFCACVGCIDGLLVRIKCPTDVPNPRKYWSGHKKSFGINVQAICDAQCRILAASFNTPGDRAAHMLISSALACASVEIYSLRCFLFAMQGM